MITEGLASFSHEQFLNLETYKRSGQPVATPVWFVQDGNRLYVRTGADSGKVKRIRNRPQVRFATCDARGALKGAWLAARAHLANGDEAKLANRLGNRKYGLAKRGFDLMTSLRQGQWATIVVELEGTAKEADR